MGFLLPVWKSDHGRILSKGDICAVRPAQQIKASPLHLLRIMLGIFRSLSPLSEAPLHLRSPCYTATGNDGSKTRKHQESTDELLLRPSTTSNSNLAVQLPPEPCGWRFCLSSA
ncbi:hypothetical protein H0G86_007607 [Trichoderma simmonsii]|uniref:Uncharacterized protein n=1 Tax=Trichoderma simmonsii TaxID=1491479 RepID=A0A8G0LJ18_9HYPO|nr:hypothetical protein H0G86_007607 [Trichoderma simmonsii]